MIGRSPGSTAALAARPGHLALTTDPLGAQMSDQALLELVRDDPGRGAPHFYDRFQKGVNRLVWRLLGADAEHDDLVQQVFLIAFQRIAHVREPEKLPAWVHSVAVNVVRDELRKRRVRKLFLKDRTPAEMYPSLVHDVEVRDFLLRAKRVLDTMPASQRIVFLLHVLEGKDLPEVSELCRHSLATAKRRLARANRRFAAVLAHDPDLQRLLARASDKQREPVTVDQRGDS